MFSGNGNGDEEEGTWVRVYERRETEGKIS